MKKLLTVAGSDSSGGAGIQADLKTFAALGAYGMSCICAVTAQNTRGVSGAENMTPAMVKAQLRAVYDDIPPDALKTGMLSSADIVETVADFLKENKRSPFVADPVMVATSGDRLLAEDAVEVYKDKLIGLADLLTPNIPEAEVLSGISITDEDSAKAAAEKSWNTAAAPCSSRAATASAVRRISSATGRASPYMKAKKSARKIPTARAAPFRPLWRSCWPGDWVCGKRCGRPRST